MNGWPSLSPAFSSRIQTQKCSLVIVGNNHVLKKLDWQHHVAKKTRVDSTIFIEKAQEAAYYINRSCN
jgi:hypothetical protein